MINFLYLFNFLECGHFCVKYILKKEGKKKNVDYCKRLMSLGLIKKVLKEYFDYCECYFVKNLEELKNKKRFLTVIKVRGKYLHYIVVEDISDKCVYYYDPFFCFLKRAEINKFKKKWANFCCFYS